MNIALTLLQKMITILQWWQGSNEIDKLTFMLTALAFLMFTLSWYASRKSKRQCLPPGPRGFPLVGNLLSLDPQLHVYFASLAQIYGPIVALRLGTKTCVLITSPVIAREVLKDHDITFANRDVSNVNTASGFAGHDIVFTPYGPEWRMLRKVCVRDMLGSATLDAVYSLRRQEIRNLIGYCYNHAGSQINVGEQMFLTVFNVITNMLWGGTIQGEERTSIGVEFREVVAEVTQLLGKPNISDFFPVLAWLDLQGIQKGIMEATNKFHRIFNIIIKQRLQMDSEEVSRKKNDGKESEDFLQVLLHLMKNEADAKTPLTMLHVKALLMDMMVGGTDTTSNTVEFAVAEMMNKPEIIKKAQQELDSVIGKDCIVEESHISKLPYLNVVFKEILRLHPVLPLMVPHCPSESCIIGGYTIPKGSRVFVNVWAMHRDPSIWENPLEFDPERFLNGKVDYSGNDFNYLPFGSGRRICAGIAMAERMVMFSLASLLHSFDWKLPEGEKLNLSEKFGIVLKKKKPLFAIPTPRLSDPALYE